jgi:polyisoprenoid-binding protein YceI
MKCCIAVFIVLASVSISARAADGPCVIPGRGHFQIQTGTSGLFGMFAHDHVIEAQRIEGCAQLDEKEISRSSIKLTFATSGIRVLDPKESANDRAKVQETMETEVLRISEYPTVVFESTSVDRDSAGAIRVHGNLTIRGKTQPVIIPVAFTRLADGTYRAAGSYKFKQTTFGIRPIQLAGGTVKVKDELRTEFELFLK